jgi:hypothetical protein
MPFIAAAVGAIATAFVAAQAAVAGLVFTITGSLATTVAIMTLANRALLAFALNAAVSLIAPKPKAGIRGDNQKPVTDPNTPRQGIIGEFATAGSLTTWQTWGTNNEYIILLFALADHKCHSLTGMWWNGAACTINGDGSIEESLRNGKYHLWVTFYDGSWTQSADSELVTQSAGRWTNNDRGRGVCYVKVKARFNSKVHDQGLNGLFSLLFKVKGAFLYDRRLDTTAGGSGSQRENDQTTWTWSDNAAVAVENVLRGLRVEDTTMTAGSRTTDVWFGCGLTSGDLPYAENVAAMNSCDEAVTLKAGGTEKRYRANGLVWGDQAPRDSVEGLLAAQAGRLLTGPGRWIIRPGVARSIERSFVDSSFRLDGPATYKDFTALGEVVNCVTGRFCDPAQQFKANPLPPRTNSTYEAADGGRKSEAWDFPFITSQTQGQRCLKIFLERHRRQKTARRTLAPENLDLEALDWIGWQSDRHVWDLDFEIEKVHARLGEDEFLQVVADLRETDASVYAWTAATDELDPSTATAINGGTITAAAVAGLTVTTTTTTATGEVKPGLLFDWTEVTDPTAWGVRVEYRKQGTTAALTKEVTIDPTTADVQQARVDEGVVGTATFEGRAAILYNPWIEPVFSSWVAAAAATTAAQSVPGDDTVTTAKLVAKASQLSATYFTGSTTIQTNSATTVREIGALTITTTDQPLEIGFSVVEQLSSGSAYEYYISVDSTITHDGTAVSGGPAMIVPLQTGTSNTTKQTQSFSAQIPGLTPGSHTFKLWVRNASGSSWTGFQRNLFVNELKKQL